MSRTKILPYIADKVTHSWANDSLLSHNIPEKGFKSKVVCFLAGELLDGLAAADFEVFDVFETTDF